MKLIFFAPQIKMKRLDVRGNLIFSNGLLVNKEFSRDICIIFKFSKQ